MFYKTVLFFATFLFLGCFDTVIKQLPPIADAGSYQYLSVGSTITLNGSQSYDPNHDPLSYNWRFSSKPLGSSATIANPSAMITSFVADVEGSYVVELIVNDGQFDSAPAIVGISTYVVANPSTGQQAANEIYTSAGLSITRKMLVIRLNYGGDKDFVNNETTWQNKLFGTSQSELNHYYQEISQGQFSFEAVADAGNVSGGVVTVEMGHAHPDPDIDASNFTDVLHPELKQAIEQVSSDGFDFSIYDSDGNGYIASDELIITFIMAGEEDAYSGGTVTKGVWAHQWCTENTYTPNVNTVKVMSCAANGNYAIFGERHHDSLSNSHDATVGIIAHELGHSTFDLPDLYYGSATRIGYYGLMSNGSWGQASSFGEAGDTPTHMTPWSKMDIGWFSNSSDVNDSTINISLYATGENNYNIIKTPFYNSTDEYFLIENRGVSSYDAGLKFVNSDYQGGVAIWHIDESVITAKRTDNIVNSSSTHKGVDIEEAAGSSADYGNGDPELNLYYQSNVSSFTPNTQPNTNLYSNDRSYIFITDVSSTGSTMTLKINNPTEAP